MRRFRLVTGLVLVLHFLAPLSSGDKGLWLSVAPAPIRVFAATASDVVVEHSTLLPVQGIPGFSGLAAGHPDPAKGVITVETGVAIPSHGCRALLTRIPMCGVPGDADAELASPRGPPA